MILKIDTKDVFFFPDFEIYGSFKKAQHFFLVFELVARTVYTILAEWLNWKPLWGKKTQILNRQNKFHHLEIV